MQNEGCSDCRATFSWSMQKRDSQRKLLGSRNFLNQILTSIPSLL